MKSTTLSEDVRLESGAKFPGDNVIYLFGRRFDIATVAWAMRAFVQNERLRYERDPNVSHWQHDPVMFYLAFLHEALETMDEDAFNALCRRYRLWRYWR